MCEKLEKILIAFYKRHCTNNINFKYNFFYVMSFTSMTYIY